MREQFRRSELGGLLVIVGLLFVGTDAVFMEDKIEIAPVGTVYICSMPENDIAYPTYDACRSSRLCAAGLCTAKSEMLQIMNFTEYSMEYVALLSTVHVGHVLQITVEEESPTVSQDPGLPIGMSSSMDGSNLMLHWEPRVGQEGFVHEVVVEKSTSTKRLRIRIPVAPEAITWVHPKQDLMMETTVGLSVETDLMCQSNYPLNPLMVKQLDNGFQFNPAMEPRMLDAHGEPGPAPPAVGHLRFEASHGHEGTVSMACFGCMTSTFKMEMTACVHVKVSLCKYATTSSDTLLSITRMYHQNNNWRRLWNINPSTVPDPQHVMGAGTVLELGPVYKIQEGDNLANIAGRFDTTIRNLLKVNPFINDEAMVKSGEDLCVTPCTNQPTPSMDMKFAY